MVARLLYGNQWLVPVPDIDRTAYFLVFGANPAVSNGSLMTAPGLPRRIKALLARGGKMVLFDPRRTEIARLGGEHHYIRPGTDAALILGLVRVILDEGLASPAAYVDGLGEVRRALEPFTPERVEAATGVVPDTVRRVAREFAAAPAAARYVPGVLPKPPGTRHNWEIFRELARRYGVRRGALRAALMLRLRPDRIVDLGLRTGPYRLTLDRLRRLPQGADLGELRPGLPRRLQTPRRRVRTAPPVPLAAAADAATELLRPPDPGTLLLSGRRHLRANNSWMHNSRRLVKGRPRHHLLMYPGDMAARDLGDGDLVTVRSAAGELTVEASANAVTDPAHLDQISGTAVLNGVPVTVERHR
ncbi:molybdopterin dinucleotide binding domain-containing protein [Nonomuraea sp. NPDC049504]|uniref:molybdopterin dinucleotide binding domain-containing protein n=1 Tax=Nonomuraea sp. NPDC049504 TaxID=3154729 RepID=UPI0034346FE9